MNQESNATGVREQAQKAADEAKRQASDVQETVRDRATDVADVAQKKAGEVASEAEDQAQRLGRTVEDEARSMADTRKGQVASELQHVAKAFHTSGDQLREQGQEAIAGYTDEMANQLERASLYLKHRNVDGIVRDAEDFARRQPEVFLAGAFGLGMLAARFLKSSRASGQARSRRQSGAYGRRESGYERDEYALSRSPRPLPQQDASEHARLYPRDEGTELG